MEQSRLSVAGYAALLVAGVVAVALASSIALTVGAADVSAIDVVMDRAPETARQILLVIRLPRIAGAILVGSCLAVAGATLQSVMRNPLADPYILGISSGASVGAAFAVIIGAAAGGALLAFATALLSVMVVYRVAKIDGRLPPLRLLLAGVALSSFASAVTGFLLYLVPEATAVRGVMFWLMGGLGAADWSGLSWAALLAVPASAALMMTGRWQTLLLLGDEAATAIGLDVARARRWLIALTAVVTGALVAFAGAIGFVGLIVPHALRPFTGPDHRRLLPAAAIYGALLMVVMDTIARTVMAPEELPVGILSGLLGAPFFLLLLARFEGGRSA
jgi:iron complex transport system permease protein